MQGHEFENNVHKQLDDLRVSPSADVWNRVEMELRKDKKRRRLLLLWPLLLVGLGSYWWVQQNVQTPVTIAGKQRNNDGKHAATDSVLLVGSASANSKHITIEKRVIKSNEAERSLSASSNPISHPTPGKAAPIAPGKANIGTTGAKRKSRDDNHSIVVKSQEFASNKKKEDVSERRDIHSNKKSNTESAEIIKPAAGQELLIPTKKIVPAGKPDDTSLASAGSTNKDSKGNAVSEKSAMASLPVPNSEKMKQTNTKNNWQWGISGNVGVARIAEGGILNSFDNSQVMDASAYNGGSAQAPGNTGYIKSASIEPGFNWSAGFFVQHPLAKRLQLSIGFQYNYYSTQSAIGTRIDSTRLITNIFSNAVRVEDFYLTGDGNSYTSKYHFLELPVTLHVPLTKNTRHPFYWSSGLSIGQMISTNALHYDGSSGVYYKDDNLFQKTQIGFHTALTYQFFSQNKHPVDIGPQFQYKLSDLLKHKSNNGQHLLSGSLLVRWYFNK